MKLSLEDIRTELDRRTGRIVSGLKGRSRHLQNMGIYDKPLKHGRSWFAHCLSRTEDMHAELGRFEFQGQHPFYGGENDIPAIAKRQVPQEGLLRKLPPQDLGERIVDLYKKAVQDLCVPGEDEASYGQATILDVENCLAIHDRIVYLGQQVAQSKLDSIPNLRNLTPAQIRESITNKEREAKVLDKVRQVSERYELERYEPVIELFKGVIELTIQTEIDYILSSEVPFRPATGRQPRRMQGWSQIYLGPVK